jgi:putative transcriptional regulator
MAVRVFKTRYLARFAKREAIADASLRAAVEDAESGLSTPTWAEASSSSANGAGQARWLSGAIAFRSMDRAIFIYGFAKSARDNIESSRIANVAGRRRVLAGRGWRQAAAGRAGRHFDRGQDMKAKIKPNTRLTRELLEMSRDMLAVGIMDKAGYEKITKRHLVADEPALMNFSGAEIRALREKANLSQAVFAHYLNLTTGYVSQLERGAKRPTGPALVLLDVIRRKGIEGIL